MTKLIGILIVVACIYGGYKLFMLWDEYDTQKDLAAKEAAANHVVGDQLPGMPYELEKSFQAAKNAGTPALQRWLSIHGAKIQDPRRAWIELDYARDIALKDPVEAKKIFAEVKVRTPENSPVYPRIRDLAKTYD
jgi:hypothetical protein